MVTVSGSFRANIIRPYDLQTRQPEG